MFNMPLCRIHRFSTLTGLTTHVIRAWEKRYGLVNPTRGLNRYRLYSDEDVLLFRYLKTETQKGSSIGDLSHLGREELLRRMNKEQVSVPRQLTPSEPLITELIASIQNYSWAEFQRQLNGALAVIPFEESLLTFLLPLLERVGQLWHAGKITVGQEHFVTQHIQQKISSAMNQLRMPAHGPACVVCCPAKEHHEVGAQVVAYWCLARGFPTFYLGADLPMIELGKFCAQIRPLLTLISLSTPLPDPEPFVIELNYHVKPYAPIGIGGGGAIHAQSLFEREGIRVVPDLFELEKLLDRLSG